jgi:hypothetical protein
MNETTVAMRRPAVTERMPAWPDRVLSYGFPTWWGHVEVDASGIASVSVVNPHLTSLSGGQRIAERIGNHTHRIRHYLEMAKLLLASLVMFGVGCAWVREIGGWATVPGSFLVVLGTIGFAELVHRLAPAPPDRPELHDCNAQRIDMERVPPPELLPVGRGCTAQRRPTAHAHRRPRAGTRMPEDPSSELGADRGQGWNAGLGRDARARAALPLRPASRCAEQDNS